MCRRSTLITLVSGLLKTREKWVGVLSRIMALWAISVHLNRPLDSRPTRWVPLLTPVRHLFLRVLALHPRRCRTLAQSSRAASGACRLRDTLATRSPIPVVVRVLLVRRRCRARCRLLRSAVSRVSLLLFRTATGRLRLLFLTVRTLLSSRRTQWTTPWSSRKKNSGKRVKSISSRTLYFPLQQVLMLPQQNTVAAPPLEKASEHTGS